MEQREMIAILEQVLDTRLNESAIGNIIDNRLKGLLEPIRKDQVILGEVPQDLANPNKITISQYLGDVRRAFAQGREGGLKWMKPEQMIKTLADPTMKDMYGPATSTTHGGYLIPTEESRELLNVATELFSVVPGLCRSVPMRTNQITFPTMTAGLTAYWIPEAGSTTTLGVTPDGTHQATGEKIRSDLTLGQMTVTAFVCAVMVVVSNQLLDDSDPQIDQILRSLFAETLGDAWDAACLTGTGAATNPISGLDTLVTTNLLAAGAQFDYDDIVDLLFAVLDNDSKCYPHIIGTTRAEKVLMKVKDNNAQYVYKKPSEAMGIPEIWGHPFHRDGNVSNVLGANANMTRLYAGDFGKHAYAGRRMGVTVATNPFGEPYFSFNQTAFRAEFRVGFTVDAQTYFSVMEGVPTT